MATKIVDEQSRETTPVIIMCDPARPDGAVEYVTPTVAKILRKMRDLDESEVREVMRVVQAMRGGMFPYTRKDIRSWTPEQRRAAIDSLPEYTA